MDTKDSVSGKTGWYFNTDPELKIVKMSSEFKRVNLDPVVSQGDYMVSFYADLSKRGFIAKRTVRNILKNINNKDPYFATYTIPAKKKSEEKTLMVTIGVPCYKESVFCGYHVTGTKDNRSFNRTPPDKKIPEDEWKETIANFINTHPDADKDHVLCYIDVDFLAGVNSRHGCKVGDEILNSIYAIIKKTVRVGDIAVRVHGDEFIAFLSTCNIARGEQVAEKMRSIIEKNLRGWNGIGRDVTVSIGVCQVTGRSVPLDDMVARTHAACMEAKTNGKNNVRVYKNTLHADEKSAEMIYTIKKAIRQDKLLLCGQPIYPFNKALPPHMEILTRIPGDGIVINNPHSFIPVAEKYNLSVMLDVHIIAKVAKWVAAFPNLSGQYGRLFINVSPHSFKDAGFAAKIESIFTRYVGDGHKFCFEITETAIIDKDIVLNAMETLRKIGCQFAIDDFGSGYASFAVIKDLPVDYIKIDGELIAGVTESDKSRKVVEAAHIFSKQIGAVTIAERVENMEIYNVISEIKIDYAQGFQLAVPKILDSI